MRIGSDGLTDHLLLRAVSDEVMRLSRRRTTSYPGSVLDESAFRILWCLAETDARTLRDLAATLQLEQSTISRQVSAAIKHELVERYAGDRQARLLRPTDRGREAYLHDARLRGTVLSRALAELGQGRVEALVSELRALNDALDRAHGARD
jgi:DNA-binding MarR family transcriptional regulator